MAILPVKDYVVDNTRHYTTIHDIEFLVLGEIEENVGATRAAPTSRTEAIKMTRRHQILMVSDTSFFKPLKSFTPNEN